MNDRDRAQVGMRRADDDDDVGGRGGVPDRGGALLDVVLRGLLTTITDDAETVGGLPSEALAEIQLATELAWAEGIPPAAVLLAGDDGVDGVEV